MGPNSCTFSDLISWHYTKYNITTSLTCYPNIFICNDVKQWYVRHSIFSSEHMCTTISKHHFLKLCQKKWIQQFDLKPKVLSYPVLTYKTFKIILYEETDTAHDQTSKVIGVIEILQKSRGALVFCGWILYFVFFFSLKVRYFNNQNLWN